MLVFLTDMEGFTCFRGFKLYTTWLSGLFFAVGCILPGASELSVTLGQAPGEATITASGIDQGQVGALMFSDDLANWFPVAAMTGTSLGFSERSVASHRFFQLVETMPPTLSASANWKTSLSLPSDKFLVEFKLPNEKARRVLWERCVPAKCPVGEGGLDWRKLADASQEFTVGRIANVVYRAAAQAALAQDGASRCLSMKVLLAALKDEKRKGKGIVHDIVQAQYL